MIVTLILFAAARGFIVLALAGLATYALRSRPAALRHAIWTVAIASQLLLPALGAVLPQRELSFAFTDRVISGSTAIVNAVVRQNGPASATGASSRPAVGSEQSGAVSRTSRIDGPSATELLAALWAAGALLLCLRFAIGTVIIAREARAARKPVKREWVLLEGQIQEGMHLLRSATLRLGTERAVPYTWGVISPVVCLPSDAEEWSTDRLRIVLIHELAHVKRFDALTEIFAQLALVIFWFNPLLWLAVSRMRTEREHACDDYVLNRGVKPSTYVEELVMMMKSVGQGATAPAFGAIAMARRSQFESRMFAVLDERSDRRPVGRRAVIALVAGMTAILLGIGSVTPAGANPVADHSKAPMLSEAMTWDQSPFDELIEDCQRSKPKRRVQYCEVRRIDVGAATDAFDFRGDYVDGVILLRKALREL